MPSVQELLTIIKDQSLVGSGDGTDDARILRYLNLLYKEIYRETAETYPTVLLTSESVTITAGAGVMAAAPHAVKRVKDTANNRILVSSSLLDIEDCYPSLADTGNPERYYMTGERALNTYPANDTVVLVRSIPRAATLTAASMEADIKMPPEFHDALVWGTVVYTCMDERDKLVGAELNTAQSKFEIALNAYKTWLALCQVQTEGGTEAVLGG